MATSRLLQHDDKKVLQHRVLEFKLKMRQKVFSSQVGDNGIPMQIKPLLPFVLKPGNQIKNEKLNWIVYCFDDLQASDLFQLFHFLLSLRCLKNKFLLFCSRTRQLNIALPLEIYLVSTHLW